MSMNKILSVFQREGYNLTSFINKLQYTRILNSIMPKGQQFHQEVAEQIWLQSANGQETQQITINSLCMTIIQAHNILRERIATSIQQIKELQNQKASANKFQAEDQLDQLQQKLIQLNQNKESYQEDFRLLTQPFGISPFEIEQLAPKDVKEQNSLAYTFYLAITFGFFQIIMIYGKYDFLNLIVLTFLLSLYFMNFFDKVYIRVTLALTLVSIILDFVWLILYAKPKWSPSQVSNQSIYQVGYTRFIVFFTVLLMPLKGVLIYFLAKFKDTSQQDKYIVSLGIMKMYLSANKFNPISKHLANTPIFSK